MSEYRHKDFSGPIKGELSLKGEAKCSLKAKGATPFGAKSYSTHFKAIYQLDYDLLIYFVSLREAHKNLSVHNRNVFILWAPHE